jgi:hypothetical protein
MSAPWSSSILRPRVPMPITWNADGKKIPGGKVNEGRVDRFARRPGIDVLGSANDQCGTGRADKFPDMLRVFQENAQCGPFAAKKTKFQGSIVSAASIFLSDLDGGVMGFFLVLFWCATVARAVLRHSYGISVSNSRLVANKFPLRRQRELPDKRLVGLPIRGGQTSVLLTNYENSRFHGNSRECRPLAKRMASEANVVALRVPVRARAVRRNHGVTWQEEVEWLRSKPLPISAFR